MVTPTSSDAPPANRPLWPSLILITILSLIPAIWIGDTPFIFDEPALIGKALLANANGTWNDVGLLGSLGKPYGPLPTWLYQIGLTFTTDLQTLAAVRAIGVMFVTLASTLWIARLLRLPIVWVLLIAASPYLMFYARGLWDNSFNIPLAGLTTALTFHAVLRRTAWPLPVLVACYGAMLLVHPMALPLIAASVLVIGLHIKSILGICKRQTLSIVCAGVIFVLIAGWWISGPYRAAFFQPPPYPPIVSTQPNGWWFALLSPRILSAAWISYFFPPGYLAVDRLYPVLKVSQIVTIGVFVLCVLGLARTILKPNSADHHRLFGGFAVAVVIGQLLLNGFTHTFGHPHYYNATWIAPALLAAAAMQSLHAVRPKLCNVIGAILIASLAFVTADLAVRIHSTNGTKLNPYDGPSYFGPTLANQIQVARALQQFDAQSPLAIDKKAITPTAMNVLNALESSSATRLRPVAALRIEYANPNTLEDGRIVLTKIPVSN